MDVNFELPDSVVSKMALIRPASPTPHHTLCLSTLDNMKFQRTFVKFCLLYRKAPDFDAMKSSLSAALVPNYYPLAGRLKQIPEEEGKLQVDCTDDGVLFAMAYMESTVQELLKVESAIVRGLSKLVPGQELDKPFLSIPPIIIQATTLTCGGMILCIAGNHCFTDGMGFAQFFRAWAELYRDPKSLLSVTPCWGREAIVPKPPTTLMLQPLEIKCPKQNPTMDDDEPLVPIFVRFGSDTILKLQDLCYPKLECTSFELLTAYVWRCFIRAIFPNGIPSDEESVSWIGFAVNIRSCVDPPLPAGFYGNAAVAGVAACNLAKLVSENMYPSIRALQECKAFFRLDDYLQVFMNFADQYFHTPLTMPNLIVNQWSKLGFEAVYFGLGRPVHLSGYIPHSVPMCLFLLWMDDDDDDKKAVKVCITLPKSRARTLECCRVVIVYRAVWLVCFRFLPFSCALLFSLFDPRLLIRKEKLYV